MISSYNTGLTTVIENGHLNTTKYDSLLVFFPSPFISVHTRSLDPEPQGWLPYLASLASTLPLQILEKHAYQVAPSDLWAVRDILE